MCASIYVCVLDVLGWRGGNGQTCSKVVTTATEGWVRGLPWRLGRRVRVWVLEGSRSAVVCMCVCVNRKGGGDGGVQSSYIGCVNNEWCCMRSLSLSLPLHRCLSSSSARTRLFVAATIYEAVAHRLGSGALYFFLEKST